MNVVQFPRPPIFMTRRHIRAAVEIGVLIGLVIGLPAGALAHAILSSGWLG